MVFNVCIGVNGLENPDAKDPRGKVYAFQIADTVVVAEKGKDPEVRGMGGLAGGWSGVEGHGRGRGAKTVVRDMGEERQVRRKAALQLGRCVSCTPHMAPPTPVASAKYSTLSWHCFGACC